MSSEETRLNMLFHNLLTSLSTTEIKHLLTDGLGISSPFLDTTTATPQITAFLGIPNGKQIDEFVAFASEVGIAIEIKDKWKTSPGQLRNYFDYAHQRFQNPFLIFLSQNPDDSHQNHLSELFDNPRWHHKTWHALSAYLQSEANLQKNSVNLRSLLSQKGLDIPKPRSIKYHGLQAELPPTFTIAQNQLRIAQFKSNRPMACWSSREDFWNDVIASIQGQINIETFFSFRRDIYHYMWRWSFHQRRVFFEMEDDNRWEWYMDYFKANVEGHTADCQVIKMRKWYDQFLKIARNEFLDLGGSIVGVFSLGRTYCYFFSPKSFEPVELTRLNLWETIPY